MSSPERSLNQNISSKSDKSTSRRDKIRHWKAIVTKYETPSRWRANWQIVNSVGSYVALWVLMYLSLSVSLWLTIPLIVLAGGLLVRVFIIFHDCGHGSFYKSATANRIWGRITGLMTFSPFYHWKWEHDVHHQTAGHLDRRGVGDIWTLTVEEYLASSRWRKCAYRLARNPVILFVIAPFFVFLIHNRFPHPEAKARPRSSIHLTNVALVLMSAGLIAIFGFFPWLIIQMSVLAVAGTAGVWLFYVQHQFEDAYWEHAEEWDYTDAAMKGSSFYKLPRVLQWFSGNIGFHHIHHLSHKIPNYNLERCHRSDPMFEEVNPLTLLDSLHCINYRLWDASSEKLISFRQLKKQQRARAA